MNDAAKKRGEYLRKLTQAEVTAGVALIVVGVFGLLAAYSLFFVCTP